MMKPANAVRLTLRLPLFLLFLALCTLVALLLRPADRVWRQPVDRAVVTHHLMGWLCWLLGFRVNVAGTAPAGPALYVSNHISWTDIPVLAACMPLHFLAKQEVAGWPLIGWLAGEAGTLYIKRRSGQAAQVRDRIACELSRGRPILVFPEGTTTAGISVLPFHGRLLGAAVRSEVPVQPITIGYRRDGLPDPVVPFIGDDGFVAHLIRLLQQPPVTVEIVLHSRIPVATQEPVDRLARVLTTTVAEGLDRIHLPGRTGGATPTDSGVDLATDSPLR